MANRDTYTAFGRLTEQVTEKSYLRCGMGGTSALLVTVLLLTPAEAATQVSGTVPTARWSLAESPYRATADLRVPSDATLTLDPGVIVQFDPDVAMVVEGTLNAAGISDITIVFRGSDPSRQWDGLVVLGGAARGTFKHVEFTGAAPARAGAHRYRGAFSVVNGATVRLEHCWFHGFEDRIIESTNGSEIVILDSLVEDGKEGIHSASGFAHVERVCVRDIFAYSDSIDFDYPSEPPSIISDCLIENNEEDDGIDLASSNAIVEKVVIRGIQAGKAVSMDGRSTPMLSEILIYDCQQGLVIKDSCSPDIQHVTITRCETAVDCYEKIDGRGGGRGTGQNMIIWENETSVALDELSTFDMTYSVVAGGYPGTGNVDADPIFVNPAEDDFHLVPDSPARGAGHDSTDAGAYTGEAPPPGTFIRSDANRDGSVDLSDPVAILLYLFGGNIAPNCPDALDADDRGQIDLGDAIYVLQYAFAGGPPPPPPFPEVGPDPTEEDGLSCDGLLYFR